LNIVTNAMDAVEGRKNAQVGIRTELEPGTDAAGDWVRITVVDNGVGIPPDELANIFKPFHSTKGERGTGLGLAVSRKILREHGGDILVQSVVGKASRFILRFPLLSPQTDDNTINE
jgi:signal transduction histidine kinase